MSIPDFGPLPDLPDAECANYPGDWWFPDPTEVRKEKAARNICRRCPARAACLTWALDVEDSTKYGIYGRHGIWGGLTPDERARLADRSN